MNWPRFGLYLRYGPRALQWYSATEYELAGYVVLPRPPAEVLKFLRPEPLK